ncbi:hypothetical protein EJB05_43420 [Eragrostis curvula]|uniref:Uncharacterized protein n=1 Tax=Eragrostis curvula TaxID=38414 RepID=A0A5J9TGY5_9POAL|nr:hypothetical protein EJB05_43420 [Eragrostis curvula]
MGIQGNKAATHEHDFLSLYTAAAAAAKDSPLELHADAKPAPPLKTHDFLQPLEKPGAAPEETSSSGADARPQQPQPQGVIKQHALPLPGGVGTFSICPAPAAAVIKAEPPLVLWGQPASQLVGRGHQWTLPFAGAGQVRPLQQLQPERHRRGGGGGGTMDSGSRSSGGAGFDDDDGLAARREVSSSLKDNTLIAMYFHLW